MREPMTPDRFRCLEILARRILEIRCPHPVRVAIDGPDCAGKTTLADELAGALGRSGRAVIRASIDGFHRPRAERLARGPLSPDGYYLDSFDYAALRHHLLDPLGPAEGPGTGSRAYRRRVFDYRTDEPVPEADAPAEVSAPDAILLFDGVFLLRRELARHWDFTIFVAAPFSETQRRAEDRDLSLFGSEEEVRRRYQARYIPGQQLYFASERPQSKADVVVDNADPARPRLVWP